MTKYDTQFDSNNSICPYCGDSYQVESEDYDEHERIEECENCGKKYYLHESFSVDHWTRPDCLINSEKHDFEFIQTKSGGAYFCKICGKCKLKLPDGE